MSSIPVFEDMETEAWRLVVESRPQAREFLRETVGRSLPTRNHRFRDDVDAFSLTRDQLVGAFGTRGYQCAKAAMFECLSEFYSPRADVCKTYTWREQGFVLAFFYAYRDSIIEYPHDSIEILVKVDRAAIASLRAHPERYVKTGERSIPQVLAIADGLTKYALGRRCSFHRGIDEPEKPRFYGPVQNMPSAVRSLAFPGCTSLDMQASQPRILNWLVGGRFVTLAAFAADPVGVRERVAVELGCPGHGKALTQGLFFGQGLRAVRGKAREIIRAVPPESKTAASLHDDVRRAFAEVLERPEYADTLALAERHVLKQVSVARPPREKAGRRWHEVRDAAGQIVPSRLRKVVERTAIAFILQDWEERAFRVGLCWLETVFPGALRLPLHDGWVVDRPELAGRRAKLIEAHIRDVTGIPAVVLVKALDA